MKEILPVKMRAGFTAGKDMHRDLISASCPVKM
jgi:hypothetical protein